MGDTQTQTLTVDPGRHIHLTGRAYLVPDHVDHDVWVHNNRVTFMRPSHVPEPLKITGYIFPGLVDMHCHIGLNADGPTDAQTARDQAETVLRTGVTLVRDAGSPLNTSNLSNSFDSPRIVRAGQHIARPKRYLRNFAVELDRVEDLPAEVRRQARAGSGWVKIVADWIDRDSGADADLRPLWPRETLREAAEIAHAEAARISAHAFSTEVIDDLLDAGFDSIEHGTGMTRDQINRAAETDVIVIPTLLQVGEFDNIAQQADARYPRFAARMRQLHTRRYEQVNLMYEMGVRLLVGTDAGGTITHGSFAAECAELVAAGISPEDVMAMASWEGREYLGQGNIIEGSQADFAVFRRDPTKDITALNEPVAVVVRGRVLHLP